MTQKISWFDKSAVVKKSKSCTWKQSKKRNSFTTTHQQADVQLVFGKQGLNRHNGCLGRQMTSAQMFSQHPPFLQLLFLRWTSYGMGYPFGYLGQLAQLFPLSISCPSPAYRPSKLLEGCWRESPDTAQQYPNLCATSAILTTDERHRPYRLL